MEQYCRSVEALFLTEMFPRPNDYLQPQKSSAWLEKARQLAIQGEKRVEPYNFQPQSCVKLNNIEAARRLLDKMYDQMQADNVADTLRELAPPVPEKAERERFRADPEFYKTFRLTLEREINVRPSPFPLLPSSSLPRAHILTLVAGAGTEHPLVDTAGDADADHGPGTLPRQHGAQARHQARDRRKACVLFLSLPSFSRTRVKG